MIKPFIPLSRPQYLLVPLLATALAGTTICSDLFAAELLGADEILTRVNSAAGAEAKPKSSTAKNDADRLLSDLESFKNVRAKLSPEEGVDRWLKLYDRFRSLPATASPKSLFNAFAPPNIRELSLAAVVAALPAPDSWDLLKSRIMARQSADTTVQDNVIKLVLFHITRDQAGLDKALAELKSSAALGGNRLSLFNMRELRPENQRAGTGKNGTITADSFDAYLQSLKNERPTGHLTIQVPDLVALGGEKRAAELVEKALSIPGAELNVPSGGATLKLAKQVVLKKMGDLAEPQWELITGIEDVELFEAMDKRFPEKNAKQQGGEQFQKVEPSFESPYQDNPRQAPRLSYILGLISRNRVPDAIAETKKLEGDELQSNGFEKSWHSFDKLRYGTELHQFCTGVLTARPELPLWKQCGLIAVNADKGKELVAIIDAAAAQTTLSLDARMNLRERKVDLLLSMDRVDDAVVLLREALAYDTTREASQARAAMNRNKLKLAARLALLGKLLSRPELIRDSEQAFVAAMPNQGPESLPKMATDHGIDSMVEILVEAGEFATAVQIVLSSMQSMLKAPELGTGLGSKDLLLVSGALANHLVSLTDIYDRAGRHEDVLVLLEKAGWWGAVDLLDVADFKGALPTRVARALYKTGRNSEAVELAKWQLLGNPGDDGAYQVLTDIQGSAAIPWLEYLHGRDRFEERPLIWKAILLKRDGKLDEAEKVVRQALKIDPTDGEQKAGDRGRAYVVLAEILKARGKGDDAAFFERVVSAVRIAETGDRMTDAGMLKKSLALYEQASNLFGDAYCVQWRLAERLSSMGDLEEARKHYEIAFERMPEQFGQVASFCFGCEGVFTHQQSVGVAERVLTGLSLTAPDKPQVQYLLGQLRESQGRKAEAYRHFSRAAEIDPGYLDALKSAYKLSDDVFLSQAEMDLLALRMLRLDPLLRHNGLEPGGIADVKGVWEIYAENSAKREAPVKSLLPLTASKQELETVVRKLGGSLDLLEMKRSLFSRDQRSIPEPGEAVVRNQFVLKLLQYAATNSLGME